MSSLLEKIKSHLSGEKQRTVYRFISAREKTALEEGRYSDIGTTWQKAKGRSTHKYKQKDVRYLHFLDNKTDARYLLYHLKSGKSHICTYTIPTKILSKYSGTGYYPPHGYDDLYTPIKEYAIPTTEYDPTWLVSMETIDSFLEEERQK